MSKTASGRGGARPGAGRKRGSGSYGEPTEPVRVPLSLLPAVREVLRTAGKGLEHPDVKAPPSLPVELALPFYTAKVAAGLPLPADDQEGDALDLNQQLIRHPRATFFVKVQGQSMIGAGIQHGDLLVVDRALEPKSGAIVIAVVNGDLTVKRLRVDATGVWLMPENPDYQPIEVGEGMDLLIWGVVVHVIHSL